MGQRGGSAETRRSHRGKKRAVSGELGENDHRESISRRLPEETRGQKRSSEDGGEIADQRESISRRLPDSDEHPALVRTSQPISPEMAGAVSKSEKKKVKWNWDVEDFESKAAWEGAQRDIAVVRNKLGCKHDVSEFDSPPRVVKMARTLGMKGGVSLDLTVPARDGYIWDFSRKHCRDKAMEIINEQKPLFLKLSPECTPYSQNQNLNMRTPAGKAKVDEARRRGDVHLLFCVTLARR